MTFAGRLGGKLFARRLAASALAGSLLGAGHDDGLAELGGALELFGTVALELFGTGALLWRR
jgi:hypothetical protein